MTRSKLYVQYGCGFSAPEGWRNFDASPTLRYEKIPILGFYTRNKKRFPDNVEYGDIVKGLPIPLESCSGLYASHILEHLALEDFRIALKNSYDLLANNGIFRIVVPDIEAIVAHYTRSVDPLAAHRFMEQTYLGRIRRPRGLMEVAKEWFGNSNHMWMWDFKSLKYELENVGFKEIRRCYFGDSVNPMFNKVEDSSRFVDAVGIECIK